MRTFPKPRRAGIGTHTHKKYLMLHFVLINVLMSSEVRYLLLDLDFYDGTDLLRKLHVLLKRPADVLAYRLSVVFRRFFVWAVSLLAGDRHRCCQRCSNFWCRFVPEDLWNAVVCFQPPRLLIEKAWLHAMHYCVSHTLQCALENGQEARIVQIDFSAACDKVDQQGIQYKLCSVGIGGSVLSILTEFLSNRSQHVMVDGCCSKLVNIVSGVP